MSSNLAEILFDAATTHASRVCLRPSHAEPWSYHQVHERACELGAELLHRGASRGDRVLVQIDKSPQAVCLYLACVYAGLTYVPLNTAYTESELAYFLQDADPVFLLRDQACPTSGRTKVLLAGDVFESCRGRTPLRAPCSAGLDDPAAVLYTSGTTGRSKGAVLSHRNLLSNARALREAWGWRDDDVLLHALPIYHVHGLFVALHSAFFSGSEVRFLERFDVAEVLASLPGCTVMMGVPTHYSRLLQSKAFDASTCETMRVFISGSAPMTLQLHDQFEARTGHRVVERYGLTEGMILTSSPLDERLLPGTVGFPLPGVTLRISKDDEVGGAKVSGDGIGEVQVKSPGVFLGYLGNPEATAESYTQDAFLRTGDLGSLDREGRLSITGRAKDLIISGGLNVYPKEVEVLIDELPGIRESAVIGVPHHDFGEAVVAVVASDQDVDLAGLRDALADQLARFKLPKKVVRVDELPRNQMGKVQKVELRLRYGQLFAPETGKTS